MLAASLDFSGLHKKIELTQSAARRDIATAVRKACEEGVRVAKSGSFKDRTGNLRATIQTRAIGWQGRTFWMQIHAPAEYAHFVDLGTKEHDIWPKAGHNAPVSSLKPGQSRRARGKGPHEHIVGRGRALRWKDDGGGQHFARMIHHPGSIATLFFGHAIILTKQRLLTELNRGFVNIRSVWN